MNIIEKVGYLPEEMLPAVKNILGYDPRSVKTRKDLSWRLSLSGFMRILGFGVSKIDELDQLLTFVENLTGQGETLWQTCNWNSLCTICTEQLEDTYSANILSVRRAGLPSHLRIRYIGLERYRYKEAYAKLQKLNIVGVDRNSDVKESPLLTTLVLRTVA